MRLEGRLIETIVAVEFANGPLRTVLARVAVELLVDLERQLESMGATGTDCQNFIEYYWNRLRLFKPQQ